MILGAAVAASALTSRPAAAQRPDFVGDTLRVEVGSRASATMPVRTRSVEVLGRDRLALLPVRTLAEALRWSVGVELLQRSPAQADVSIRGAGFEQVLVLVDGARMSDPQTGHFDLDLAVPLEQVERIEILRGPASALYGADAVGGVVNVVTRAGAAGWAARVEGGSDAVAGAALSGGVVSERLALRAGAGHDRSDGHRPGTDYEVTQAHARLSTPAAGGRVTADAAFARRAFGAQDFYVPSFPAFERTETLAASLGWASAPGAAWTVLPRLDYRRHEDDFVLKRDDPSFYRNRHTSSQLGGEVVVRRAVAGGVDAAFGAEARREALWSSSLGERTETRTALFAEAALAADAASATFGLRGDGHEAYGAFVSPSAAASLRLGDAVRLRASAGRSFRAPTWTERYYRDPAHEADPELAPERAWSGDLGADVAPGAGTTLRLTGWLRRSTDLIDWARPEGAGSTERWRTRNVQSATFRGLEAELAAERLGAQWTLGGSLLDVQAESADGFESKYALRPVTRRLTAGVARPIGTRLHAGLFGQAGTRADGTDFRQLDARLSLRMIGGEIRLDVTNLTDADYPDPALPQVSAPGRAWTVGFSRSW